jgi:hypothetical protein
MISYYRDEEYVLVFWREVLQEYFSHVQQRITSKKSDLVRSFTLHSRRPAGLSAIIVTLSTLTTLGCFAFQKSFCYS